MSKKSVKINTVSLQEALTIVKPGLSSKEIIEQSSSFAFMNDRVTTYNDSISISHPVEGVNLTGAIKADELYNLLSKITNETISIEEGKDNSLLLKAGKSRAGFTFHNEIKLPLDEISLKGDWKKLPEGFCSGISKVLTSASNDMSRPVLTCIHACKKGWVEASDSVRGSRYTFNKKLSFDSFLLEVSAALPLMKLNPTHVMLSGGWLHFKNDKGTIFSARTIKETFPDITNMFSLKKEKSFKFPKGMSDIINKAEPFYKRAHILQERVEIIIEANKLTVKASADESKSWFEETMKCSGIDDMAFSLPPSLLLDILKVDAKVEVNDRFFSIKDGDWSYVGCTNIL